MWLGHNDKEKKWILDIDNVEEEDILMLHFIDTLEPNSNSGHKVLQSIKSKSGIHLITKPFNVEEFKKKYPEIEVHKDNPTNLYIP